MIYPRYLLITLVLTLASGQTAVADEDDKQLVVQAQEFAKEQKFDQAIAAMKKAIQMAPRNDLYIATLSDIELKAGKYADGQEHALQAIKLNDKVGAYYVLAAAHALGNQDVEASKKACEEVMKRAREFGSGPVNDIKKIYEAIAERTITLTWNLDPQNGRLVGGTYAIALPKTNLPYQTVTYEIQNAQSHRLVKGEVNDVLYVVPQGKMTIVLTTKVELKPYSFKNDIAKAIPKPIPADVRAHLGPIDTVNLNSPALKKLAKELKGKSNVETARNILDWMKKNIEYKLQKTSITELDFKVVDEIIERKHAECRGYAILFTALCRAADVPARPIWGLACVYENADRQKGKIASHNWAEVYVPGFGWVPVDPQKPETFGMLPGNIIRVFMDAKKTKMSQELLPMLNLVFMVGDRLKFEESAK